MKIYLLFTSLAGMIMFAGAAISSDMMAPKGSSVKIQNYAFGPESVSTAPGKEVVWVNNDSSSHTVLIDGHESPRLRKGGEYRHTFTKSGEYHYKCGIHKSMKDGNTVSIVDFMRFSPTELTVAAGTEVTWDNHDGSNHIIQFGNVRSPRLRHDSSFSYRFDKPGEYPFICAIHGKRMSGKISVK